VLWILFGCNGDPDPSFYLNAAPDPYPGSQPNADPVLDPDPCQTLKSQKLNFYLQIILVLDIVKKIPTKVQKYY
jgi:hypothetical protein